VIDVFASRIDRQSTGISNREQPVSGSNRPRIKGKSEAIVKKALLIAAISLLILGIALVAIVLFRFQDQPFPTSLQEARARVHHSSRSDHRHGPI